MPASETLPVTGSTAQTRPENRAFYPALDGLRAVAFFMVFYEHYGAPGWGRSGVDLFFVLSGFLITGILYDSRNDAHRVRNFYVRRTLRIFPLYYAVLLALLLIEPLAHWRWSWAWLLWPAYLGNFARFLHPYQLGTPLQYLGDFQPRGAFRGVSITLYLGHFWSLCVEEQFYLVWPWLVFWVRSRRALVWICAASLPLALVLRLVAQHSLPAWMLGREVLVRATPFRLDALLAGGLVALLLRGPHAGRLLRASRWLLPVSAAALALLVWVLPGMAARSRLTWGLSLVDGLSALLLLVALQPGTVVYRLLSLRPLRWLGTLSYGMYVLHYIPNPMYHRIGARLSPGHTVPATAVLAFGCTVLLAWLSFRYLESPFLNLKERWTRRAPLPVLQEDTAQVV